MIPLNSNLATLKRSAIRVYTNLARQTPDCAMLTIGGILPSRQNARLRS